MEHAEDTLGASYHGSAANPWSSAAKSSPLEEILAKASDHDDSAIQPHNYVIEQCRGGVLGRHLSTLQQTFEAKMALKDANLRQLRIRLEQDAPDVTRSEELRSKIERIVELLSALEVCVSQTDLLYDRLEAPTQGNALKLQSSYHRGAITAFTNMAKCLGDLQSQLDTLEWNKKNGIGDVTITKTLDKIRSMTKNLKKDVRISSVLLKSA